MTVFKILVAAIPTVILAVAGPTEGDAVIIGALELVRAVDVLMAVCPLLVAVISAVIVTVASPFKWDAVIIGTFELVDETFVCG